MKKATKKLTLTKETVQNLLHGTSSAAVTGPATAASLCMLTCDSCRTCGSVYC